jgi:hypothetical protein
MDALLAEDGLVGPFNFTHTAGETRRIAPPQWMALLEKGATLDIDTTYLNRVIPLG